jgi:16S rRNA (guanine966-N2)-methyltransferase
MRVISGKIKGRRVKAIKSSFVRPTADRVKEALFNILPHDLEGLKVLDLFAGTGNLSIEALSRGAKESLLVDVSRQSGKTIRDNLDTLGLSAVSQVWIAPVFRSLRLLAHKGEMFDLIFLDPPYEKGWVGETIEIIADNGLLRPGGVLVAEHSAREKVDERYGSLMLRDQRRYGTTLLSFFGSQANRVLQTGKEETKWRAPA